MRTVRTAIPLGERADRCQTGGGPKEVYSADRITCPVHDGGKGMEINGRKVKETGLFQSGKGLRQSGAALLCFGIITMQAILLMSLKANMYWDVAASLAFVGILLMLLGVSNIVIGSRIASKEYQGGELQESYAVKLSDRDKVSKYVAFVESEACAACGADLAGDGIFCSKCGERQKKAQGE